LRRFDKNIENGKYDKATIIKNSLRFSEDIFEAKIREIVGY
jgi:hypothetical protein